MGVGVAVGKSVGVAVGVAVDSCAEGGSGLATGWRIGSKKTPAPTASNNKKIRLILVITSCLVTGYQPCAGLATMPNGTSGSCYNQKIAALFWSF